MKQINIRNAVMRALGRHGVSAQTAESIWTDLTTGNDPRPANLPGEFWYRGIKLTWPNGRHLRLLRNDEIHSLNAALKAAGKRKAEFLDNEDNAETGRHTYDFLFQHMGRPEYNPEPVRAQTLRELVAQATETPDQALLTTPEPMPEPVWDESVPMLVGSDVCTETSPKGKACTLASTHDGQHVNGGTRWGKRDRVYVAPSSTPVDTAVENGRIPDPCKVCGKVWDTEYSEAVPTHLCVPLNALAAEYVESMTMCGAPGPFDGVTCERDTHEDDDHAGFGYAWLGKAEVLDEVGDEPTPTPKRKKGKGKKAKIQPTVEIVTQTLHDGRQTTVEIVTTPERVVHAQAVPLEPTSEIDDLLAQLNAISTRLGAS